MAPAQGGGKKDLFPVLGAGMPPEFLTYTREPGEEGKGSCTMPLSRRGGRLSWGQYRRGGFYALTLWGRKKREWGSKWEAISFPSFKKGGECYEGRKRGRKENMDVTKPGEEADQRAELERGGGKKGKRKNGPAAVP